MNAVPKITEMQTPPKKGQYYLVPCALFNGEWIPVFLNAHTDPGLGVPDVHYHRDTRFIEYCTRKQGNAAFQAQLRVLIKAECAVIEWFPLICRRAEPEMPPLSGWEQFEPQYIGKKAICGKCPHRQMNLNQMTPDKDGSRICVGHGLKFDKNLVCVKR